IQKALPICKNVEEETLNNLRNKLNDNDLNTQQWLEIYQKMLDFNTEIQKRYSIFSHLIEKIQNAKTLQELDMLTSEANTVISRANNVCQRVSTEISNLSNQRTTVPVVKRTTQVITQPTGVKRTTQVITETPPPIIKRTTQLITETPPVP